MKALCLKSINISFSCQNFKLQANATQFKAFSKRNPHSKCHRIADFDLKETRHFWVQITALDIKITLVKFPSLNILNPRSNCNLKIHILTEKAHYKFRKF